jgi:hypothetical protein
MASDSGGEQRWSGFADYEDVAKTLHDDVHKAIKAYSHINSKRASGVGVTPQTAVRTRSAILGITKRLFYEVKRNRRHQPFDDIFERWAGVPADEVDELGAAFAYADEGDAGFIARLEAADFTREVPGFLGQLVDDIVTAAWELGYIRAGVEKPADPEDDDEQVRAMIE